MVHRAAGPCPRSPEACARRDRTGRDREHAGCAGSERILHLDNPAVRRGRVTERAQVAAEVHEHTARALADELPRDEIGGVTLTDAAEVEPDVGRQPHRAHDSVEHDAVTTR